MHRTLIPLVLLGTLAAPAHAQSGEHSPIQGTYAIRILVVDQGQPASLGCLVNGEARVPSTPYATSWSDAGCDSDPRGAPAGSHLWEVHGVGALHVIRSRRNGYCLVRGDNGAVPRPQLHLWSPGVDHRYCGFPDARSLIEDGRALWDLSGLTRVTSPETGLAEFQGSIHVPKIPGSYLAFDSTAPGWHANNSRFDAAAGSWRVSFVTKPSVLPIAR